MSNPKKTQKKSPPSLILSPELKKSGKWTEEEDNQLQQIVPIYNERHWRKISQHMQGRSAIQCLHRWTKILKPGLVKGPWSVEEDDRLIVWVQEKGPLKWAQCAHLIPGRSGKQCRERWFNNLNPNVKKGEWSPEEDDMIFKLYVDYGSSWSKIAQHFKDRTENSIKNRFYSTIRKLYSDKKKLEKGKTLKKHIKKQLANAQEEKIEDGAEKTNANNEVVIVKKEEATCSEKNNKNIINTLYNLLRSSNMEHPPHINKIYASGIYKKSRRYRRKGKKTNELANFKDPKTINDDSLKSLTTKISSEMKSDAFCSDTESDGNFENFLSSIEQTINKELILREIDSYKDFSIEELQKKIYDFCDETPLNLENEDRVRTCELEQILNHHIEKEIVNGNSKNPENVLEKAMQEDIMMKCEEENHESDKKMFFLVQQLQTLENMLTKTRQELISLENSLQVPEKNHSCLSEKEDDFYMGFNENMPAISEWNMYKRKASVSLEDFFDLPLPDGKKRRFNFMEEELGNDNIIEFKEEH